MCKCYQVMPLEVISEKDWLILMLTMTTMYQLVKLHHQFIHNVFGPSASLNKTVPAFHLFFYPFAIKSANNDDKYKTI